MKRLNEAVKRQVPAETSDRPVEFDELPSYVGYQVRRTQAKIFSEFEATLKDFDFSPGSFGVLTLIRANPGITQVTLAAAFGVDKSTMSPVIFRLEKRGLIRREVLPSDRRCHALFFEETAEADFLAARQKIRAFEEGVAARLSKTEQRELNRLLSKLRGGEAPGLSMRAGSSGFARHLTAD
jgi:DNA-binding MarR family transcriptional regulator